MQISGGLPVERLYPRAHHEIESVIFVQEIP
jgi:hypothetical protein